MARSEIGFVVIEWNQASRQPSVVGELCQDREEVDELKAIFEENKPAARRETYSVALVVLQEDE